MSGVPTFMGYALHILAHRRGHTSALHSADGDSAVAAQKTAVRVLNTRTAVVSPHTAGTNGQKP
jgi:hypothetical protein